MTTAQIAAQLAAAPSHPALEAAIAALAAAPDIQAKSAAQKTIASKVAVCRRELGMDPGLFASAE